jgi:glucose-induced degradation protein 4
MPTPQLIPTVISTSSRPNTTTGTYSRPLQQESDISQGVNLTMAPAGSVADAITPKTNRSEADTAVGHPDSPLIIIEDTQNSELDQRSVVSRGSLASPEPPGPIADDTIHRKDVQENPQSNYNLLYRPLPEARYRPNSTSTFLKPNARFTGIQRSEKQKYEVVVDVKHVDMDDSFMSGYLKIHALTEEHPTLTTYFEGEMIGSKYSFITKHAEWQADEKVDLQHWAKFPAWRPFAKDARRPNHTIKNWAQKENIWMRWKEHFLVPDHSIKDLVGASFDGFYYICFNQVSGTIHGTYFHRKCERSVSSKSHNSP